MLPVVAVRTAQEWTWSGILAAVVLAVFVIGVAVWAIRVTPRR